MTDNIEYIGVRENPNDIGGVPKHTKFRTTETGGIHVQHVNIDGAMDTNVYTNLDEVRTFSASHICSENSSTTPLGANAEFVGGWQTTLDYSEVIVSVFADKDSATDGLKIEWSAMGDVAEENDEFTIYANVGKTFSFPSHRQYVRVRYKNNGVAQTKFSMQTMVKRFASKGSSHRLLDPLSAQDDAIVTKSQIVGLTAAGGHAGELTDVKVNPSGALSIDGTVELANKTNALIPSILSGEIITQTAFDFIGLTYTDANLTSVIYRTGGAGGSIVKTLTLGYDGTDRLTSVTSS